MRQWYTVYIVYNRREIHLRVMISNRWGKSIKVQVLAIFCGYSHSMETETPWMENYNPHGSLCHDFCGAWEVIIVYPGWPFKIDKSFNLIWLRQRAGQPRSGRSGPTKKNEEGHGAMQSVKIPEDVSSIICGDHLVKCFNVPRCSMGLVYLPTFTPKTAQF